MMPTLGAPELIIILVIIILIFGVGKLPEVGQALGKGIREFRGAADGGEHDDEAATAAPARPAAPAAVEAPRPAPAVEAPRQPVTTPVAPAAPAAPAAATTTSYTVSAGDTPETIATKHGVTVDELLSANGWSQRDRVLYEGDKILVPARHTAA
jgi:sec-independent protein translocase protein TatA